MTISRRTIAVAAATVVATAAVAAAVAVLGFGDRKTVASADAVRDAGNPHAPVKSSAEDRRRLQDAIEATSTSPTNADLVAKGRELFRSNALAKAGESCQGCHTDGGANASVGTTPHKVGATNVAIDFNGLRDPPSLYGVGTTAPYFWNGNVATLEQVADGTIRNHFLDGQDDLIDAIDMTRADAAVRLAAYMRTFQAPESDFTQGTMSADARAGLLLFQGKAGCIGCHFGPNLTDNRLHDILVPQVPLPAAMGVPGNVANDPGALAAPPTLNDGACPLNPVVVKIPLDIDPRTCAINTPTLGGVSRTGPYMHNGVFTTLEEVVDFYNADSIIAPLGLTPAEMGQVVEFLKSL